MTELGTTWLQEMEDHLVCPFSGTSWWAVLGTVPPSGLSCPFSRKPPWIQTWAAWAGAAHFFRPVGGGLVVVKEEPTVERVRSGKRWVNEQVHLLSFPGQNELGQAGSHPVLESSLEGAWGALGRNRSAGLELRPQKVE